MLLAVLSVLITGKERWKNGHPPSPKLFLCILSDQNILLMADEWGFKKEKTVNGGHGLFCGNEL
jgi:hypothetical protein